MRLLGKFTKKIGSRTRTFYREIEGPPPRFVTVVDTRGHGVARVGWAGVEVYRRTGVRGFRGEDEVWEYEPEKS